MTNLPWELPPGLPNLVTPSTPPAKVPWKDRGSSTSQVVPLPGVLPGQNLKSWSNWRAFLYSAIPPVVTAVTAWQTQFHDPVTPWILIVLAVVGPLLSAVNSTDKARQAVYGVLGLASTSGFIATLFSGHPGWIPVASAGVAILSNTMARFYTPTTTLEPAPAGVAS